MEAKEKIKGTPREVWEFIKGFVPLVLLVLSIRCFLFSPFKIPSGSMIPTLLVGDHLFVSMFKYGVCRYSFFFGSKINYFSGRIGQFFKPSYGEVVVFAYPSNPSVDYIKRVVGLPNDTVQMKKGCLYINGEKLSLKKVEENYECDEGEGMHAKGDLYEELLPGGKTHLILKQKPFGKSASDNTPLYKVPQGHYMMVGDNRDGSADSRFLDHVGYVPEEYIIGPAWIIWLSLEPEFNLWKPWLWPLQIRYRRLLKIIR